MKTLTASVLALAMTVPVLAEVHKDPGRDPHVKLLAGTVKGERFWTETRVTGKVQGNEYFTSGITESETFTHYVFTLDTLGGIRVFESDGYASRLDAILDKGDKVVIRLRSTMKNENGEYRITPSDIDSVNGKKIRWKDYN